MQLSPEFDNIQQRQVSQSTLKMFDEVYEVIRLGNEKLKVDIEHSVIDQIAQLKANSGTVAAIENKIDSLFKLIGDVQTQSNELKSWQVSQVQDLEELILSINQQKEKSEVFKNLAQTLVMSIEKTSNRLE